MPVRVDIASTANDPPSRSPVVAALLAESSAASPARGRPVREPASDRIGGATRFETLSSTENMEWTVGTDRTDVLDALFADFESSLAEELLTI